MPTSTVEQDLGFDRGPRRVRGTGALLALVGLISSAVFGQSMTCGPTSNGTAPGGGGCLPSCQTPIVPNVNLQLVNPNCDPTLGPCQYTGSSSVEFPANRLNGCIFAAQLIFDPGGGNYTCLPCVDIQEADFSGTVDCSTNPPVKILQATMCPSTACSHQTSKAVDPRQFFCSPPPDDCPELGGGGGGAGKNPAAGASAPECHECKQGGGGSGQPVSGGGVGLAPAGSGPGASLRYLAHSVGVPSYPGSTAAWAARMGRNWSHDYAERIVVDPDASHVWFLTRYGTFKEFSKSGTGAGNYTTRQPSNEYRTLTSTGSGWQLKGLDGTILYFRADGYWDKTVDRNGNTWQSTYDVTDTTKLTQVTPPDGRKETFGYDGSERLTSIAEVGVGASPPSRTWSYTWGGSCGAGCGANDLSQILRPDGMAWQFLYEDASHPGFVTRASLVGGTMSRIEAGFDYDSFGNTAHMWRGDTSFAGAGAVDKLSFSYTNPRKPTQTIVTDSLGTQTTYTIDWSAGAKARVTQIQGECGSCGLSPTVGFTFDPVNPNLALTTTDGNSIVTGYSYDTPAGFTYASSGRLKTKTEAQGNALQRVTTWTYGNTNFLAFPTLISQPSSDGVAGHNRASAMLYDAVGNLQTRTIDGFEAGSVFPAGIKTTTMGYNSAGRVTSVDPPGIGDTTTFAFAVPNTNGQIPSSRTDPVVGTTSFAYDGFNRLVTTTDPNGLVTETQYDGLSDRASAVIRHALRNWVIGNAPDPANDLKTTYFYDCPAGTPPDVGTFPPNVQTCRTLNDLRCVQMPLGNAIENLYDGPSGRLVYVRRKADCNPATQPVEQTVYTYNTAGNRTRESLQRWTGATWVEDSATKYDYTVACHVDKVTRGDGSATTAVMEYCYDANNNLTKLWDANHAKASFPTTPSQTMVYDALNRLKSVQLGSGEITQYGYDVQDHLNQVTDAETNVTQYTTSDRDAMTRQVSPVTGTTTSTYDAHAQLATQLDARGVTTTRTTDALDRVLSVTYSGDASLATTYAYDGTPSATSSPISRLASITKGGSPINYSYDHFGRMTQDGALSYSYDRNGNRTQITYPGPVSACYAFDVEDRPSSLSYATNATCTTPTSVVNPGSVTYAAAGPLTGLTLGNAVVEARNYDTRYYPTLVKATKGTDLLKWVYTDDTLGNITTIDDQTAANLDRAFTYQDYQYFLTTGSNPNAWGPRTWTYDTIGNRLTEQRTSTSDKDTYAYVPNSTHDNPKLQTITFPDATKNVLGYDAAGNVTEETSANGALDFGYDASGKLVRMLNSTQTGNVKLRYDGRGYLTSAQNDLSDCSPLLTFATYGSDGRLFMRDHRNLLTPLNTVKTTWLLYFADRPIAQLDGTTPATAAITYLTTDHLGTAILATTSAGTVTWSGGFEAFGRDWQSGASSALSKGIFLRFPGQWNDEVWAGSGLYQNVNRWYEPQTGRYTSPDPLLKSPRRASWRLAEAPNPFLYAKAEPLMYVDPLGLEEPAPAQPTKDCNFSRYKDCCGLNVFSRFCCKKIVDYGCNPTHPACCDSEYFACLKCGDPTDPDFHERATRCLLYQKYCETRMGKAQCP